MRTIRTLLQQRPAIALLALAVVFAGWQCPARAQESTQSAALKTQQSPAGKTVWHHVGRVFLNPNTGQFVDPQVVHNDDIGRLQRRHQNLLDIGQEQFAVDRTINGKRGGQAVATQRADKGCGFPMSMRHGSDQAMATFCPAIKPRHAGLNRAFINKNKL